MLEPAVDAAVSAGATNSLEKMLLHQMATVHVLGMKAAARANDESRLPGQAALPPVEQVRLLSVMAECFGAYQTASLRCRDRRAIRVFPALAQNDRN